MAKFGRCMFTKRNLLIREDARIGSGNLIVNALFTIVLTFSVSHSSFANMQVAKVEGIRQQVREHLETYLLQRHPELVIGETLIVKIGQLDQRLRLAACNTPLRMEVRELPQSENVTIKTSCTDGARWSIYVPATVEIWRPVLVASRNLARGELITADDVTEKTVNTAQLVGSYVSEEKRLVGMELKRPVRAFETIKLSSIKKPNIVHKGDTVVLKVQSTVLTVKSEGTALTSGTLGAQVKVRNKQSKRIVDGRVTGPGEVQVAAR